MGSVHRPRRPVSVHSELFFSKKYGGRGASGRRGDRPTTCTVLEASQERVRYASAPGCPGRWRASLALTDLHTHCRQRRSTGTRQLHTALPVRRAIDTSTGGPTRNTYLSPSASPDRRWRAPSGSAVATGRTDDPHSATSWQQKTQLRGVINVRTHEGVADFSKERIYA